MSVYYLQGQSNSGNTNGLTGYYYPLYTDESLVPSERYHTHTFAGLANEVFYMPENETNHAVSGPPVNTYYGNYMYQEYATYNVANTIISYTNISTAPSQSVISIASSGRDYNPFDNSAENTESLRVEELIPEQLRGSSERFITLIKDYYTHLNSKGLPTYETNRIIDEHDIDEISSKYLDGIQGEIAKNIPDSNVMDRVSLYKKIVKYYTLKGSEESITTFFRLFFDEIIEVSYPKERLFELSAGDWRKDEEDYAHVITAAVRAEDLGTQYNWTPFQMKDDSDIVLGTGSIVSAEEIVLHDIPPAIGSLVFNLNAKKNLNSINQTWDSVELNNVIRGYFYQGASFNQYENLVKFNGKGSLVDFGEIYTNPDIPTDTQEHTFVVRAFPRSNKEDTEIQPFFSLSKDYASLHSHELFFSKTTRKIGRSFIDTGEPRIEDSLFTTSVTTTTPVTTTQSIPAPIVDQFTLTGTGIYGFGTSGENGPPADTIYTRTYAPTFADQKFDSSNGWTFELLPTQDPYSTGNQWYIYEIAYGADSSPQMSAIIYSGQQPWEVYWPQGLQRGVNENGLGKFASTDPPTLTPITENVTTTQPGQVSDGSLIFSNFIDQTSVDLISLNGDRLDHMNSFLSPLGKNYNGRWEETLIMFNGREVYVHESDPVLTELTQEDLKFYTFNASSNTFNGPDNLKIGDSIYGEGENDFTDVVALSKDGLTLAVGSSLNDPEHIPGTKLRIGSHVGNVEVGDNISQTIGVSGSVGTVNTIDNTGLSGAAEDNYTDVPQTSSSGSGTGATFNVTIDANGDATTVAVTGDIGSGYIIGDTITIAGSEFGGSGDLTFAVETFGSITVTGEVSYVGEDLVFSSLSSQVASDGSNTTFAETSGSDPSKISWPQGNAFGQADVTLVDSSGLRGNNAGSVKVYTLATHKLRNVPSINRSQIVLQTLSNEAGVRSFEHFDVGDSLTMAGEVFTITEVDKTSAGQIDWSDANTSPGTQYPYAHSYTTISLDRYPSLTNNLSTTIPTGTLIKIGDANIWSQLGSTIDGEKAGNLFGSDIAINNYGNRIAIGAPKRQSEATDAPTFNGAPTAFNSTPEDENFTGEIQVWNLRHNTSVWENSEDEYISGRVPTDPFKGLKNSRLGTNISMDASGRYIAFGSGANPNIDFDIGTEDGAGILLEDGGAIVGAKTPTRDENELPEVAVWYDHSATLTGVSLSSNNVWMLKGNITASNDASAGVTVKLSEDGERLLIGTHQNNESGLNEMVVKLFGYQIQDGDSNTTWRQIGSDVTFIADKDKDQVPLSFSSDGTKFAVGILGDGTDETFKGQVEVYSLKIIEEEISWVQIGQTLEGKNAKDAFGSSVNLNSAGNVVVIGSPGNDESENNAGKAEVFSYSSVEQTWEQVGSDILGTGNSDGAGTNVSINSTGSRVSIASPGNDEAGQNKGKIETFQVSLKANIREFMLWENNPLDSTNRWAIKSKDKVVYYTDWYSTALASHDLGVKWYKANKQGDESLPVLPHCECVKNNNEHLFTLHNRGYLSIFYKHNDEYIPWQDITIGDPTTYGGERLWDILDYAVNGDYLILLDRPVNEASRLVILKVDEYNRYNFYQTVSLNLPSTHLGSADFAHIKSNHSQIIVGTHTFNNTNISQVIQVYNIGENNRWSSEQYSTLPSTNVTPVLSDLEFDINKNVIDGKWTSTNNLTKFETSVIHEDSSSDDGIRFDRSYETLGSGLGFNINNNFAISLRFNALNTFSPINNILTIGNVTLRIARNPTTNRKELQIVSQEPGKNDYPVFLDKINEDIILDDNPLEIFSDEYFNGQVLLNKWNNLTVEFTVNAENLISGLRYSLNGFKRSKSLETESGSLDSSDLARHGITSTSQLTLYNNCAFSHISFYDKELTHTEFESLERNLSTNYTETITTGINSLLDGGKFDISETGTIIAKVSDSGIYIWEKISSTGWRTFYNTLSSITDSADNYITHNGSRLYSFKFFGDDLLIANGGVNNAKQFVDQYNSSTTYNKAQHNSRAKLYYIQSQYTNAHNSWKLKREFSPSLTFSQNNNDDFKVGLNYGVDIAVDSANNAFAISLEPDSVNKILNGPNPELFNNKNTTNVKYDIYRKLNDNFRLVPYFRPDEGFSEVSSYGRRLNSSAVLKIVNSAPSYSATLAFPNIIHTTLPQNPMVEYKYRSELITVGYYKGNEYNSDFVISTAPSPAVYSTSATINTNTVNTVMIKGKADRYYGYVDISVNGSNFERIIQGNTIRHLSLSPESKFILGKSGSGSFNGDISHSQYYTGSISDSSRDKVVSYYIKNVKKYYKLTLDTINGSAIGATKLTSMPFTNRSFVLDDLTGHAFTSFLVYEAPEFKIDQTDPITGALIENPNTSVRLIADYGENITADEVVYWGDGRSGRVLNNSPVIHTYTLEYLGDYFDKKGRASSTGRIQDSVFWQKFSYVIRSGLKVDDWESTFLNLVHPAGLRFFASVILLVIRDNHWFGPKYLGFNSETRENYSTLRVEDKYLAPFRTKQPVEDMRWLEGLTAPSENGGYHLPMFQPGWLQGDIRVREFMFEAGLWTKLARSVPGNDLSSKYTYEYFENGAESGDIEFRILSYSGDTIGDPGEAPFQVGDVVSSGEDIDDPNDTNTPPRSLQKRGIVETIAPAGTNSAGVIEYTGILKSFSKYDPIYVNPRDALPTIDIAYFGPDRIDTDSDGIDDSPSRNTIATISTVKVRKKEEVINVYGTEEQDAAYLLQDQSSINVNSEMFIRAILMTFKYVIPSLVPLKEFTKRDYEQNLKFKDIGDISSYLPITIKDALNNSDVFMNVAAIIKKRNQLFTEGSGGIFLETDDDLSGADQGLLLDDIERWFNDPTNDNDISIPVQLNITSYTNSQIQEGDIVYQDIVDDAGNNLTIEGLVVRTLNSRNSILVGWRSAINNDDTSTVLPSKPELDQLFQNGEIYTVVDPYSSTPDNTRQTVAQITINT